MARAAVKYRLGLDLGTNSIGWAAVEIADDDTACRLLDLGVRIFPDGRDAQSKQSNAVNRRLARGQRRRRDRYLRRRGQLMQSLIEYGLMPEDAKERKELENKNPYEIRAHALDRPLQAYELGRALFHLNQRRGFKSNRKSVGDANQDSDVRTDISNLRERMEESGSRTLGEFLYRRHRNGSSVRARPGEGLYPDRAMFEAEFDAIRSAQERHHNLNHDQWQTLRDTVFFQRDLHPVEPGWCLFEEGERRSPRALPVFQEFRLLQEVNNLRVLQGREPDRALTEQERNYVLERLRSGKNLSLSKPTGLLKTARFNLSAGMREAIKGDETAAIMASTAKNATARRKAQPSLFGNRWLELLTEERNEIVHHLLNSENPEDIRQMAITLWDLDEESADAVAHVSLPSGYGNLSEKAILNILPHLEAGLVFSEAVQCAGYKHHSDFRNEEAHDELPYYGTVLTRDSVGADSQKDPDHDGEPARYGRISNPTVHIGLGQLRRVVNKLVETYGQPEEIVVELARDLKMNPEQKQRLEGEQNRGRERNEFFRKELGEETLASTPDALRKLRLWEEQQYGTVKVCPYTGKTLSLAMVLSAQTEVDHILPFSRTLDNSASNLVICLAEANRQKGNQTPAEAFGDGCLEYVKDFPANKRWRFQDNAIEHFEKEERFLDRQLNETQYLSRTARTYLAYLYDEQGEGRNRVRAIPGRMTALLRRAWGLEGILRESSDGEIPRKQRDDHRHHAIDAFIVANTTQGLLKKFADAAGSEYQDAGQGLARSVPPPWQDFDRNHVKAFLNRTNRAVSYKPDHGTRGSQGKTSGQLHKDTAYGVIEPLGDGRYRVVQRKKLTNFTAKDLNTVPDPALRDALRRLWDESGGSVADFAKHAANPGVQVGSSRQKVRRVRVYTEKLVIPVKDDYGKVYKGYEPQSNELAEIWRMPEPDASWKTVVISTFSANQPTFNSLDFRPHPAAKLMMRLQINDMGALGEGQYRRIVRVRKMDNNRSGPRIFLDDHNEANVAERIAQDIKTRKETNTTGGMKDGPFSAAKLRRQGFRKVRVDELGRIQDRGPYNT